jgi:hypothetical protein
MADAIDNDQWVICLQFQMMMSPSLNYSALGPVKNKSLAPDIATKKKLRAKKVLPYLNHNIQKVQLKIGRI